MCSACHDAHTDQHRADYPDLYMTVDEIDSYQYGTFVNRELFELVDDIAEYEEELDISGHPGVRMYFSEHPKLGAAELYFLEEYDLDVKEWDSFDYKATEREDLRPEGVDQLRDALPEGSEPSEVFIDEADAILIGRLEAEAS